MATVVHTDPRIVDRRLRQYFNSTRDQWIGIVKASVAARARCTENNARSAPGYYAWDAGTARARKTFRREGWEKGDHEGLETIWHPELKKMVAVMNTDLGTSDLGRSPRNRTYKGSASKKVVDLNNQIEMFRRSEVAPKPASQIELWYLCIFDDDGKVRAELSRPSEYNAGYVVKYSERIFILEDGDWEKVAIESPDDADHEGQDFEIDVVRRK
jgi:hypothetical protein